MPGNRPTRGRAWKPRRRRRRREVHTDAFGCGLLGDLLELVHDAGGYVLTEVAVRVADYRCEVVRDYRVQRDIERCVVAVAPTDVDDVRARRHRVYCLDIERLFAVPARCVALMRVLELLIRLDDVLRKLRREQRMRRVVALRVRRRVLEDGRRRERVDYRDGRGSARVTAVDRWRQSVRGTQLPGLVSARRVRKRRRKPSAVSGIGRVDVLRPVVGARGRVDEPGRG